MNLENKFATPLYTTETNKPKLTNKYDITKNRLKRPASSTTNLLLNLKSNNYINSGKLKFNNIVNKFRSTQHSNYNSFLKTN